MIRLQAPYYLRAQEKELRGIIEMFEEQSPLTTRELNRLSH